MWMMTVQLNPALPDQEADWIARTQAGDQAAFNNIVSQYQRPIFNLCYRMLNDPLDAEDAAQEVFMRAYLKLRTYDDRWKFSTWLFAIASHYCLDRLKRSRPLLVEWQEMADDETNRSAGFPEQAVIQRETDREMQALLHHLHPDYRSVVVLKYWHELSCEEIAQATDGSVNAVKSRLFRARRQLAELLDQPIQPTPPRSVRTALAV
jgi:RNA polymerase sigma-70 factor (ECF subfamily)